MGVEGAQALLAVLGESCPALRVLDLRMNDLGPEGMAPVAALLRSSALRKLRLCSNYIGPAGASTLAAGLASAMHLTSLDVSNNALGPEGLAAVVAALPAGLQALAINQNGLFGDKGVAPLATLAARCPGLRVLYAGWNNLGAAGARQLAGTVATLPLLHTLHVFHTQADAAGLCAMLESGSVTKLGFDFASVPRAQRATLLSLVERNCAWFALKARLLLLVLASMRGHGAPRLHTDLWRLVFDEFLRQ